MLAVTTWEDFPNLENKIAELGEGAVNLAHLGANVLARGKALYKGHAIAALCATVGEQAAQIEKVSTQVEMNKPVISVAANGP